MAQQQSDNPFAGVFGTGQSPSGFSPPESGGAAVTSSSGSYTVEARPSKVRTMAAGYKSNIEDVPPPLRQSKFYPDSPTVGFGVNAERTRPDLPHRSRPAAAARASATAPTEGNVYLQEGNVYLQQNQGYAQSASSHSTGASNVSRRLLAQAELARREVELQEARVRQAKLEAELAAARSEKGSVAGSVLDVGNCFPEPALAEPESPETKMQRLFNSQESVAEQLNSSMAEGWYSPPFQTPLDWLRKSRALTLLRLRLASSRRRRRCQVSAR